MNILITGSSGILGSALAEVLSKDSSYKIAGLDLIEGTSPIGSFVKCDITDYAKLSKEVKDIRPDFIIHTAAYTDVDGCEQDPEKAESINGLGTRYVAEAAEKSNAGIIYISTDFVFDGEKKSPYKEDDAPNPINVYGKSKLDGERFVQDILKGKDFFIIRTSWMFGKGGRNFIDVILKKAQTQKTIRVVSDQFGSPTYAPDLAGAIKRILDLYQKNKDICDIYHITNSENCSWFRLAQKTLELANIYKVELTPIISEELGRPAERPAMSILNNSRYIRLSGEPLRPWDKALEEYMLNKAMT